MILKLKRKRGVLLLLGLFCIAVASVGVCLYFYLPGEPEVMKHEYCVPRSCYRRAVYNRKQSPDIAPICIPISDCPVLVSFKGYESICLSKSCFAEGKVQNSSFDEICMPKICVSLTIKPEKKDKCLSDECVQEASAIVGTMDKERDPCNDFYEFACGNFVQNDNGYFSGAGLSASVMAENRVASKIREILENDDVKKSDALQKAKEVYDVCMEEEGSEELVLNELKDILTSHRFGAWPALDPKWNDCNLDIEWKMAILNAHGVDSAFKVIPEFKGINQTLYGSVYVSEPVVSGICEEDFEKEDGNFTDFAIQITRKLRLEMYRILNVLEAPENTTESDLDDFFRFDAKFCNVTKMSRGIVYSYKKSSYTLQDLNFIAPKINWNRWHSIIFSELGINHRMEKSPIYVYGVEKSASAIADLLHSTPARTLANYFSWKFAFYHLGFTSSAFSQFTRDQSFFSGTTGFLSKRWAPRWKKCAKYVAKMMPIAIIPYYIGREFNSNMYKEMNVIMQAIRETFNETLRNTVHLEIKQKTKSIKKIGQVKFQLLYPQKDRKYLDEYYSQITTVPRSFLKVRSILNRFYLKRMFEGVLNKTNITELEYLITIHDTFSVSEWSDFSRNFTAFSLAMMEKTGFSLGHPRYLNFGSFGTAFARQIARGFDVPSFTGESMMGQPPKNWTIWPIKTMRYVEKKSLCFKQQHLHEHFGSKTVFSIRHVDAEHLDDIIVENEAVQIAFKAYRKFMESFKKESERKEKRLPTSYTNQELFFIKYAQTLCSQRNSLDKLLVNGALSNMEDFSKTFQCSPGKKMNPKKRCESLWSEDDAPLDSSYHADSFSRDSKTKFRI